MMADELTRSWFKLLYVDVKSFRSAGGDPVLWSLGRDPVSDGAIGGSAANEGRSWKVDQEKEFQREIEMALASRSSTPPRCFIPSKLDAGSEAARDNVKENCIDDG